MELGIPSLPGATLVAHAAAVSVSGRPYALAALAVGGPEGGDAAGGAAAGGTRALTGLALHWGCAAREGEGWAPPPAGWHTVPDRSYAAGARGGDASSGSVLKNHVSGLMVGALNPF